MEWLTFSFLLCLRSLVSQVDKTATLEKVIRLFDDGNLGRM
jgi:hypothetical protein